MIAHRSRRLMILVASAMLMIAVGGRADDAAPGVSTSVDCGTMALYTPLRSEGHPAEFAAIDRSLPEAHRDGYSLLELRDAGRSLGMACSGVKLGAIDFPLDRPALAHISRDGHGHYIVVRPVGHTGKLVQVVDPGRGPLVMESADLLGSPEWTGRALVPDRGIRLLPAMGWVLATIPLASWALIASRGGESSGRGRDASPPGGSTVPLPEAD